MEGGVYRPLTGTEIHGFHTMEDLDLAKMKEEAMTRWLRPNEIHAILCNYAQFNINVKPVDLPPSGAILLFDRKMLRNFRKDGHNWKKKKDGKTVKEAHEHLKVGNLDRIHVYYAHGEDNPNFVRRIYWLLDKKLEHIVLVHYREVFEDNTNQYLCTPKGCKEALSLSNRVPHGSPITPVNSNSSSFYSEISGSRVFSEEIDSVADGAVNDGDIVGSGAPLLSESTELQNQLDENLIARNKLTLHEINTLDWEDLVEKDDDINSALLRKEDSSFFDQQKADGLSDLGISGVRLLSHHVPRRVSSVRHPTNVVVGSGAVGVKQLGDDYFRSVGDENIHQSVFDTSNRKDFDMVATGEISDKNALQTQDSFETWMKYTEDELQFPRPVSPMVKEQSSFQEQVFTITDISPAWAFSNEETKVILVGHFNEAHAHLVGSNLYCVFGDISVPIEMVQVGVFRCLALPHAPGFVNFYLTSDGHKPISQILNFEYRTVSSSPTNNGRDLPETDRSKWEELQLQIRLAHLLFSTSNISTILSSKISPNTLDKAKHFSSVIPSYEKKWINFINSVGKNEESFSQASHNLFELILKSRFRDWLLERVIEGCKMTARDQQGQGVIHLCAILGYSWAVYPFSHSGLSLDYRDAHGWTALHWAAYYGREKMVAFLLSAEANPSLVTDPTPECPGGYTAADLASISGYEGVAAYLAEKGLTAHFQAMKISGNASGTLQASTTDVGNIENLNEEELCRKDSLAAYLTAADAASRIHAAFRERSLKLRTKAVQLAKLESEEFIIAALKIQHAFHNYKARKRMAAATRIQHRFRTWKIRREFLNMRRQAIKIQAAFRGHQVRRQYCKILWSVGVLEKAVLRWRQKRKGLRGLQVEPTVLAVEKQVEENDGEEDFYKISRKHAEDRVERAVVRVQSMFRSYQVQKDYRRMKEAVDLAKFEYDDELFDS